MYIYEEKKEHLEINNHHGRCRSHKNYYLFVNDIHIIWVVYRQVSKLRAHQHHHHHLLSHHQTRAAFNNPFSIRERSAALNCIIRLCKSQLELP